MEIDGDLNELKVQNEENDNDTDSDCSTKSEDILDSVYPVQPRKTPKSSADLNFLNYQDSTGGSNTDNPENSLFLLKDISKSHKNLLETESQREELELYCQVTKRPIF
jgi:hypothetical protein